MTETPPRPLVDDLTPPEQALIDAAQRGHEWVCSDADLETLATTDDSDHLVRAEVIRTLLLGGLGSVDPRGVRLRKARVTGVLELDHLVSEVGLAVEECVLDSPVTAVYARLPWLSFDGTRLSGLDGERLQIGAQLQLRRVRMNTTSEFGVNLSGAHVGGNLLLHAAQLTSTAETAVFAVGLQVDGVLSIKDAEVAGGGVDGAICLRGARISGQFLITNTRITNSTGPALSADALHADQAMHINRGTRLTGAGPDGAVRIAGAHIGGQFVLNNAEITNSTGPGLLADNLRVDREVTLFGDVGFDRGPRIVCKTRVSGSGDRGAVRIAGAHIAGQFAVNNVAVSNSTGPALVANGLRLAQELLVRGQTQLSGAGGASTVGLSGASIGGYLHLAPDEMTHEDDTILDLRDVTVGGTHHVTIERLCPSADGDVTTCLHPNRVDVDGLTYRSLTDVAWTDWLHIIRCHTATYRPQPYQQLAGTERAAGHDGNARRILIQQQDDRRCRAPEAFIGRWTRPLHWWWGWLAGYGYRARRIAGLLLITLFLAAGLSVWAGHVVTDLGHHAAERTATFAERSGQQCSLIELVGVGLDRGLPLASTGVRTRCDVNTDTGIGGAFTAGLWALQAFAWLLATLAFAAYTNLIRKTA